MNAKVDSHGKSDTGRRRRLNEDHFLIAELSASLKVKDTNLEILPSSCGETVGRLFVIADGVGGAAGGALASMTAVGSVARCLVNDLGWAECRNDLTLSSINQVLESALAQAQTAINLLAANDLSLEGMGTTLTGVLVHWPIAYVFHVGDTRCYLWRDGFLHQMTTDHTVTGLFSHLGACFDIPSSFRHVLYNALGGRGGDLSVEIHRMDLQLHDMLLLSTDGLHGVVPHQQLVELMRSNHSAKTICHNLIESANQLGGPDNITAVVANFDFPGAELLQSSELHLLGKELL